MMLRATELARIQATAAEWLPQLCTITRPGTAQTSDGFPGAVTTIATGIACRVEPASTRGGSERFSGSGLVTTADWNVLLGYDVATVLPQDTIVVTGIGTFDVVSTTSERGVQADTVAGCTKRDES